MTTVLQIFSKVISEQHRAIHQRDRPMADTQLFSNLSDTC